MLFPEKAERSLLSAMRQRLQLYSVLPRVRSNSLSTLTVTQPTSTSRPVLSSPPRLPTEAPKQSQHSQLALSQPTPGLIHPPLFPSTPPLAQSFTFNPAPSPAAASFAPAATDIPRAHKRQRLQYQLDVGAYGIPKHRTRAFHSKASPSSTNTYPHTSLSVQVGEDAYFVRDNAMGIADGVGGWSRSTPYSPHHPTPSALFSRRLMHFCAAEIEALDSHHPDPSSHPPTTQFSFQHHLKPRPPPPPVHYDVFSFSELEDSLHSSLEELSEGIDVLNILERAYDSTVKSHLAPTPTPTPLTTGSSTALLAVLDHPPPPSSGALPQLPEAPNKNYAAGSLYQPDNPLPSEPTTTTSQENLNQPVEQNPRPYDAVIRIAHLGDCMGMLVRGDKIAWRSDEMWWGYNTPLQLGPPPPSSSNPTPTPLPLPVKPHTFTLPVFADDILILASDGLSDNLWDEDVLDEVLKFRTGDEWGFTSPSASNSNSNSNSSGSTPKPESHQTQLLRRKAFAGMLSEALCSRAKRVSEMRPPSPSKSSSSHRRRPATPPPRFSVIAEEDNSEMAAAPSPTVSLVTSEREADHEEDENEVPFARRARLAGKVFRGGKCDDISVIVAVISPSPPQAVDESSKVSSTSNTSTSGPSTPTAASSSTHPREARL